MGCGIAAAARMPPCFMAALQEELAHSRACALARLQPCTLSRLRACALARWHPCALAPLRACNLVPFRACALASLRAGTLARVRLPLRAALVPPPFRAPHCRALHCCARPCARGFPRLPSSFAPRPCPSAVSPSSLRHML
eukprot:228170-Chlamydomonas_euryale.AAC.1